MFDVLITNARIVDGSGRPEYRGSIGIADGKIRAIGPLDWAQAHTVIDAQYRVVTPGFIEAHGHSDYAVIINPTCESHVAQGVTTEIFGNCGSSAYPFIPGGPRIRTVPPGIEPTWATAGEYFAHLDRRGLGINVVPLAGHSGIKAQVTGGEDREVTPAELEQMKALLAESMQAGARGFSSGLTYDPVTNTPVWELVELAKVAARYGGVYATHIRSYYHADYLEAIDEAAEVARAGGLTLVLSHLTMHGKGNWGRAYEILSRMDHYRTEGMTVAADTFAYPTIGVWWGPRAVFPLWAFGLDSPLQYESDWPKMVARLQHTISTDRVRLAADINQRLDAPKSSFLDQFFNLHGWDRIFLEEVRPSSPYQTFLGQSIEDMAHILNTDPCELYLDLVMEEGECLGTTNILIRPEDHQAFLRYPHMMIGNDVRAINPQLADAPYNLTQVSPRHYGSFIRMIEQHVLRDKTLDLPAAVQRMTSLPASVYGLSDRGLIRHGMAADLVIFDPYKMRENGTWLKPNQYPDGIYRVLVNGIEVVQEKTFTGALPGQVLTR